jgi:hypothetical protein
MQYACGRVIDEWRFVEAPEVDETRPQLDEERRYRSHAPLKATRCAHADHGPHEQPQVETARVTAGV